VDLTPSLVTLGVSLPANRHDRGWPKVQLLTYVTETDQSWRFCIEPMGYRDTIWERSGYVELVVFRRLEAYPGPNTDLPPLPVGLGDHPV
jgi:hypothetical protein